MKVLISKILAEIKRQPLSYRAYEDLFSALREVEKTDFAFAHSTNAQMRAQITAVLKETAEVQRFFDLYKRSLLFDAPHYLDSYLLYLEIDRKPKDRFYQPRRRVLKQVVDALQALVDDELDELFISMPPRIGKTTLLLFFVTWLLGRDSEKSNLYSAYSDVITKAFYNGILEIINDPDTYKWHDVFPNSKIVATNSQDETINIDRKKRYPSITCRSLYGTVSLSCIGIGGVTTKITAETKLERKWGLFWLDVDEWTDVSNSTNLVTSHYVQLSKKATYRAKTDYTVTGTGGANDTFTCECDYTYD